ncbi:hypothetical protein H4582DRAFT_2062096 [Lactarius indigo]|nr:hypothetical protein H4582DRAFT_2062096 [Lactarius indigo]
MWLGSDPYANNYDPRGNQGARFILKITNAPMSVLGSSPGIPRLISDGSETWRIWALNFSRRETMGIPNEWMSEAQSDNRRIPGARKLEGARECGWTRALNVTFKDTVLNCNRDDRPKELSEAQLLID